MYVKDNWLVNRLYEEYEAILDASCHAWNWFVDLRGKNPPALFKIVGCFVILILGNGITCQLQLKKTNVQINKN